MNEEKVPAQPHIDRLGAFLDGVANPKYIESFNIMIQFIKELAGQKEDAEDRNE